MPRTTSNQAIRLHGVRHNNLKGFDLDVPVNRLIVVTGPSGSGKSSLAFDTLYAEGQRRYIETFSPYARQFFDRMDKPRVDAIENIPPAIAIEQRNAVRSTRSTVGTLTEICDHMKVLWPHISRLHCRQCGQPVQKEPPQTVWATLNAERALRNAECLVTFHLPLSEKLSLKESLCLIAKQGYQRLLLDDRTVRLDDVTADRPAYRLPRSALVVVQDRIRLNSANRARFIDACEQAYHFGKGKLTVHPMAKPDTSAGGSRAPRSFSAGLHCAACDLDYRDPSPALFSFNHPVGACPTCKGFGRIIRIDYSLAVPDRRKTLKQGAIKPWQSGMSAECQRDLLRFCRATGVPVDVPFEQLSTEHQKWIIQGDPDYGIDEEHEWPRAWYGVKGYFRWLESKAYKMHVRVLLSRYRAYTPCPDCRGARLRPDALLYRLPQTSSPHTLADFYALPVAEALQLFETLDKRSRSDISAFRIPASALAQAIAEVRARLRYLCDIGLGYLTLDRTTRTLSGGETARVNLATCLGTRLVNTLFVLDEPSVGLHPRDTDRLVEILKALRNEGNTVLVVEHERSVIEAAEHVIDLGPGHGVAGGELVFQGSYRCVLKSQSSLTGRYLAGREGIEVTPRRPTRIEPASFPSSGAAEPDQPRSKATPSASRAGLPTGPGDAPSRPAACHALTLLNATRHNLNNLTVQIPLNRFVCISGVSGSGKSTLVRDVLLPALQEKLGATSDTTKASDRLLDDESPTSETPQTGNAAGILGAGHLRNVVLVDQSILGKTPRSNPAVYTGAFDDIRALFAATDDAKRQGLNASAFSFNSTQGQCERCRGAGFEKVEMQFLSDVFIRCPDCGGRRYREHILEVRMKGAEGGGTNSLSIADVLDSTVDEMAAFLTGFQGSKPAQRAAAALRLLQEVGLGYLPLGQPINTLSGGESQRLKLVRHLADSAAAGSDRPKLKPTETGRGHSPPLQPTLFLLDEPTTGLHFDDVKVLLQALQRLVDAGHSLAVIEHNLDVLKCADWIIDLGPDAGENGGQLVVAGTPERVAACDRSHTGRFLRQVLPTNGRSRSGETAPARPASQHPRRRSASKK